MGIGMKELLVILVVSLLVFGTKKLKTIGSDLGGAVRDFKKAMDEGERAPPPSASATPAPDSQQLTAQSSTSPTPSNASVTHSNAAEKKEAS